MIRRVPEQTTKTEASVQTIRVISFKVAPIQSYHVPALIRASHMPPTLQARTGYSMISRHVWQRPPTRCKLSEGPICDTGYRRQWRYKHHNTALLIAMPLESHPKAHPRSSIILSDAPGSQGTAPPRFGHGQRYEYPQR